MDQRFKTTNTILYCKQWEQAVAFYKERLGLQVNFSNDWFVEFRLTGGSRISIADETRASVKSCGGKGFTLALEVKDIDSVWADMEKSGIGPADIKNHPWGAFYDPEGHRIEIWQDQRPLS
ncbi:MAG: VOC family protein [Desulfobacterales bacterium]|nr:VOC family protein [Desulfobacterales bacterium]